MNDFVVSARKYRPSTFQTVIGQPAIITTLRNAVKNNHLAQAFLFCGPRGVGKTTCARILSKIINCTNITLDTEACDACDSCISFNNGQSLNIYELDAASNNSVDDIRNLVDQVRFPPQMGKYKVYIIDEVHMLSANAFNAFLKTLEEPPSYAIFILATTEKHKIIPTILSRCQIFDFNRITVDDIARQLHNIAVAENIDAEPDALHIIAQKADGALRDALSVFDQIVSYAGNKVTYKDVINNLNILDYDYYFKITDHISAGNFSSLLLIFNELLSEGFDAHHFINGLSSHFRDLLVCKDRETLQLLEVSNKIKELYKKQAQQIPDEILFQLLDISNKCDLEYRAAKNEKLHVELSLMKMSRILKKLSFQKQGDERTVSNVPQSPVLSADKITVQEQKPPDKLMAEPPVPLSKSLPAPVSKTPSIRLSLPEKDIAKIDVHDNALPSSENKTFTSEELSAAWDEYVQKIKENGRKQLLATLIKRKPEVTNESIEFHVENSVQAEEMQLEKPALLSFLKARLGNKLLNLTISIIEVKDNEKKAYTQSEKFKKMAEKNPALNTLKKHFDLDL